MGPTNPTLNKNKKIILQNFGQPAFFKSIVFFILKKKEIKHSELMNNQNQEAFIVIIINYLLCLLCKIIFLKNTDVKNQIILFLFCRPIDPIFYAVFHVVQKNLHGFT